MIMKFNKILTIAAVAGLGVFVGLPARAFSISPLKYFVTVDAGKTAVVELTVKNDENRTLNFNFKAWGAKQDEQGRPVFGEGLSAAEVWIRAEPSEASLPAGADKKVKFLISVPAAAAPGSYNLGLFAEAVSAGGGMNVNGRLNALLTLQVAGKVQEAISADWRTDNPVELKSAWPFELSMRNVGNADVSVWAVATISDWRGRELFTQKVLEQERLLASAERRTEIKIKLRTDKMFWPGRYDVRVRLDYGLTKQSTVVNARVWYFPAWSWLFLGVVAFAAAMVALARRHQSE